MDQPGHRTRGADLAGRDLGGLQGRGHHQHPTALLAQDRLGGGEAGGLAGTGGALDDHQPRLACEGRDGGALEIIEPLRLAGGQHRRRHWDVGAGREPGHDVGFDPQHLPRGQRPDVLGDTRLVQQRHARLDRTGR